MISRSLFKAIKFSAFTAIVSFATIASHGQTLSGASVAVDTVSAKAQPPTFRLGDAATPIRYTVRLAIDPNVDHFTGEIAIDLNINRNLDVLWLHAQQIVIQSATLDTGGTLLSLKTVGGGKSFIGFTAAGPIPSGTGKLSIQYSGKLEPLSSEGLFRQREAGDWYVVSQFEDTDARRAFPCFDEPQWKTPWQLTIDAPAGNVVVSNTPEVSATRLANGMKRVVFAETKALPSYLVALAVGPFDVVDGGVAGKNKFALRYLAPRGRGAELRYAKEVTPKLIEILEDYFGTPYPFEKLDSVSIGQTIGFGAMENAGMITYSSRLLLAKPAEESIAFKRAYAGVGAHEIAHQWFGNLVTMKWWDDAWLNEAFATWMASKVTARLSPDWDDGFARARSRRMAVGQDQLASTRRVKNPVEAEGDIRAAFNPITYQKGGQVLSMFEQALGEEKFRDGVRRYLARHARANATSEDFMAALAEAAGPGSELATHFRGFIIQPGVPLIDVRLECKGAPVLKLFQRRLRPAGSKISGDPQWITPACFRYGVKDKRYNTCGAVPNGESTITLSSVTTCPDWLVANAEGRGYYVARYDGKLGAMQAAHAAQIPALEATALVGDASLMADAGLIPIASALNVAERYAANASPVVRQAAIELIRAIRPGWATDADEQNLQRIYRHQIVPMARSVSWREKPSDSDRVKSLRNVLLPLAAEQGGSVALRNEAAALSLRWIKRHDDIPADIADAVLNVAGKFADAAMFDALEKAAFSATDHKDKSRLLKALSSVRDPALRARAHALALDSRINGRDVFEFVDNAMESDHNRAPAFAYVRDNYAAIEARLPNGSMATPANLMRVLGRSCTAAERDAFIGFFEERSKKYLGGSHIFTQVREKIDLCIAARAGTHTAPGAVRATSPQ